MELHGVLGMRSFSAHRGYRIWVFIDETGWIEDFSVWNV